MFAGGWFGRFTGWFGSARQGRETGLDFGPRGGPDHNFTIPRRVLEHPRGLAGDPKRGKNRAIGIADVGEGQAVTRNEPVDLVLCAVPADSDDLDLSGPFLADRLDRGGFTVAGASIRRPEPEGDRRTVVAGTKVTHLDGARGVGCRR